MVKSGGTSAAHRCEATLEFSYERLAQKLRRGGNAEVFFAARAILCEGQDDVAVVRALLERLSIDQDALNTSVLDCGSNKAARLRPPARRAARRAARGHHGDATKANADERTEKNVQAVADAARGRMFRFVEDVETALGAEKRPRGQNPAHLVAIVEDIDIQEFGEDHELRLCAAALEAFCRPPSQPAGPNGEGG